MPDTERLLARLAAERVELVATESATVEDRAAVELDQSAIGRLSRMDALQVQAMARAQSSRRLARIRAIDVAIARAGQDELGWCQSCGNEIAPARLELDPAAARCIACAGG